MLDRQWYALAVGVDPVAGERARSSRQPLVPYARTKDAFAGTFGLAVKPAAVEAPLYLAGCPEVTGTVGRHFDGKIDGPMLLAGIHSAHRSMTRCCRAPPDAEARDGRSSRSGTSPAKCARSAAVDIGPSRPRRRPRQSADARHEGLELDRRGACLDAQARALRRDPLPSATMSTMRAGRRRSPSRSPTDLAQRPLRAARAHAARATRRRRARTISPSSSGRRADGEGADEPPDGRLPRADLLLHRLCQSRRAHHRARRRDR